jgi:hypothetical protein
MLRVIPHGLNSVHVNWQETLVCVNPDCRDHSVLQYRHLIEYASLPPVHTIRDRKIKTELDDLNLILVSLEEHTRRHRLPGAW